MYILFTNSGGKCDIFFLLNLIIIVIKKIVQLMGSTGSNTTHVQPMSSTQPNPTQPMWVGLDWVGLGWTYVMSWVVLNFFYPSWWVGSKIPFNPTHAYP